MWGQLRPAPDGAQQQALIQWRRRGGRFRTIATATVPASSPEGSFTTHVRPPGTRLAAHRLARAERG